MMNSRQEENYNKMISEPVGRLICKMAVPTIISMLVSAAYNLVDTYFVGLMNSNSATGAVGVVFSMMAVLQAFGFFFGQGSGTYISRQLGSQKTGDAPQMAVTGAMLSFSVGLIMMLLGLIFLEPLALFLGSTETILPYAVKYLRVILLGAPFMTASFTLNNQLRYQGSATYAMTGIMAGAVINVGLDPLLIFTAGLGITGAALATIAGQIVSFCILLLGTTRGGNLRLKLKNITLSGHIFHQIWRGGFPSLCRQGILSVATIVLNSIARNYGDAAIAAMSVVNRCMMMANSSVIGFGQGFQPVCGFNYGAGKIDRVKQGYWFCVRWGSVFLACVSIAAALFAPQIICLFRDDPEVVAFGSRILRFQCCSMFTSATVIASNMMTQVLGKTGRASLLALARQGLFLIPTVLILPRLLGAVGLQMTQAVSDILSFFLTLAIIPSVWKDLNRTQREIGEKS